MIPPDNFTAQEARRKFEQRKMTQDGPIWPVRRSEMRHSGMIRERMVEDLAQANVAGEQPIWFEIKMLRLGWTRDHVDAHFVAALDIARKARK